MGFQVSFGRGYGLSMASGDIGVGLGFRVSMGRLNLKFRPPRYVGDVQAPHMGYSLNS